MERIMIAILTELSGLGLAIACMAGLTLLVIATFFAVGKLPK